MTSVGYVKRNTMNSDTYTFASLPRALLQHRNKSRDYSKGEEIIRNGQIKGLKVGKNASGSKIGHNQNDIPWAMTVRMIPDMAVSPELFRLKAQPALNGGSSYKPRSTKSKPSLIAQNQQNTVKNQHQSQTSTPSPPPPVPGRKHLVTQTETYLEELTNCVREVDAVCQTEISETPTKSEILELYPPPTPSVDAATQIAEDEFFDFDMESEPVLDQMITQAMRWAVMELLQEEDIADIKRQRRRFQQLRKAYLDGETLIRKQEKDALLFNGETLNSLHSIHTWAYTTQSDAIKTDLEKAFLPWILEEVEGELNNA